MLKIPSLKEQVFKSHANVKRSLKTMDVLGMFSNWLDFRSRDLADIPHWRVLVRFSMNSPYSALVSKPTWKPLTWCSMPKYSESGATKPFLPGLMHFPFQVFCFLTASLIQCLSDFRFLFGGLSLSWTCCRSSRDLPSRAHFVVSNYFTLGL